MLLRRVGVFVDVPFGAGNKTELGIVTSLKDDGGNGERVKALESGRTVNVKEIAGINLRYIPLGRELLALCDGNGQYCRLFFFWQQ